MPQVVDKRKNPRRSLSYPAAIDLGDGSPLRPCSLCDASQDGAQITIAHPDSLPGEFILALSADGAARRRCRVVWRADGQIGVEFLKDVRKLEKAARPGPTIVEPGEPSEPAAEQPEMLDIDSLSQN